MNLGPAEILVILMVALLVFGPSRLPEIGRQVGRGVREFRKFQQSLRTDLDDVFADDGEDMSDRAEPAPSLPPRELDAAGARDADSGTRAGDDRTAPPPPSAEPPASSE